MAPKAGLVEVFWSVQGEGTHAGRPAYFVRFAGCNLNCVFADGAICDTPWQKARLKLTIDEIMEGAVKTAGPHRLGRTDLWQPDVSPMMILTGGEPMMQPRLGELVEQAQERGFFVALETNGTIWKDFLEDIDHISCSPKGWPITHPGVDPDTENVDQRLQDLLARSWSGEYRYVIGPNSQHPMWYRAERHYVSPAVLADGSGEEHKTGFPGFVPGAVERCVRLVQADPRWRISLQTHKFLGVR